MAYDNNMSGVLFANEKDGNEKRPDYKGTVTINGQSYDLAGWKRTSSKSGKSFLSLKVSEPRERHVPDPDPTNGRDGDGFGDDYF